MQSFDDSVRRNLLAEIGHILIQFHLNRTENAEADTQATKPKTSATADTLAENSQAQVESTTKVADVKTVEDRLEPATSVITE
ncbi:MAG: hypothetical protein AAF485_28585 [Chloroflexota bacterium]